MKVNPQEIIDVCADSATMAEAHRKLGKLKFATFAKYAKLLGVYKPNPSGKGVPKENLYKNHTYYTELGYNITSHKLKLKLLKEGIKEYKCEICEITEWNGQSAPLELDHIDGNHFNNKLDNLRILCPNCHSLTATNSGKKNKKPK